MTGGCNENYVGTVRVGRMLVLKASVEVGVLVKRAGVCGDGAMMVFEVSNGGSAGKES